jgi:iron complex outermembrane receptor protein
MFSLKLRLLGAASLATALAALPGALLAQDSVEALDSTGNKVVAPRNTGLDEVIVTAQKRDENLQSVPIAVTVLTSKALESKGIETVIDLQTVVPSLSYSTNANLGSPRIRGVGTAIAGNGNENAVSTYVDGVYYASPSGSIMSFNNISQVAVLKGPQGTLFGRNATGGLIQITTRDPSHEFEGTASATYGNHDTYGADLYLTNGLGENVAADLAVHYFNQTDGFGTNLFNGTDINKMRDLSLRSKWKFKLGDATTATVIGDYSQVRSAGPIFRQISGVPAPGGSIFAGGNFDANNDIPSYANLDIWGASLNLEHVFSNAKLTSISAYRSTTSETLFDADGLPVDIVHVYVKGPDRQFSQELQLSSTTDGPLSWVLGGYYFYGAGGWGPGTIEGNLSNFSLHLNTRQKTYSVAGFAQATYGFSDDTSLTIGARLTNEIKRMNGSGSFEIPSFNLVFPQGPYTAKLSVTKPTWRVALDHKLGNDAMGYVSYNRGFKSGGFDPSSANSAKSFLPEVLDAFELGIKSELLDRKLRVNGAVYYYNYKNIQLNTFVNGSLAIYNGDSAKIYGVDLDFEAAPTDNLRFTGGLSLNHGRYGDFLVTTTSLAPGGGMVVEPDASAKGKKLQNNPSLQFNAGMDYRVNLPVGALSLAGNVSYTGRWYATPENRLAQDPYTLVNVSLTWFPDESEKLHVKLWGKNITNKSYATQLALQVPVTDVVVISAGRTYGITVGGEF